VIRLRIGSFEQIKDLKENDLIYYSAEINTDPKCKSKNFRKYMFP